MDESLEAEAFSRELDKVLAGQDTATDSGEELLKDLRLASRIRAMDLSGESRVRRTLKSELLARAPRSRFQALGSWLSARPRALAACAAMAALLIAPLATHWMSAPHEDKGGTPGGAAFGGTGSQYEYGITVAGTAPQGGSSAVSSSLGYISSARAVAGNPEYKGMGARSQNSRGDLEALKRAATHASDVMNRGQAATSLDSQPMSSIGAGDREGYSYIAENPFLTAAENPLSTFSIDVDAASYSNVRRFLGEGRMPPADAVRVEELVNYFHYDYPEPQGGDPFSITTDLAYCPWNPEHKLVRIGIKGKSIAKADLPPNNLVFLIDSSGSMMTPDRLPLIQKALRLLVEQLRPQDRISIVTYAGAAGLVLPATPGDRKADILAALDRLEAGGSTAGSAGIQLAYQVAQENFLKNGSNRVILATDGDFNVGVTSDGELVRLIEEKREHGVFLTVLGVGRGNYQDAKMKQLADKGNGNYAYLDDILEAEKVLVHEMGATLFTIAKDVKIQVEFNPSRVQAYRLIGYESRLLKAQDFNDDKKDAGELGAGHTVTALYEVIPAGTKADVPSIDPLKYQKPGAPAEASMSGELLTVKFRYKKPEGEVSKLIVNALEDKTASWSESPADFRFAAAVAGFGMLLRGSKHGGGFDYAKVGRMAEGAVGRDEGGYRGEFVRLVQKARLLDETKR